MAYNKKIWGSDEVITKEALNNIENGIEAVEQSIPKKTSQLENDSGYITEHLDLSNYAEKDELHEHNNKDVLDGINLVRIQAWDNAANKGNINPDNYITKDEYKNRYLKRNNQLAVSEVLSVAKSYYDNRYKEDGATPSFIYNTSNTPLEDSFDVNNPEYGGAIDCSTFIGLVLRGIPVWDSPYKNLFGNKFNDSDKEFEGEDDNLSDEDFAMDGTGVWNKFSVVKNNDDYLWSINPFDWSLPINIASPEEHPVRTASQLAQWMENLGWSIPFDSTFKNVEPGDIIFWAKTNSDGEYKIKNRYKYISHVAICSNVMTPPEDFPEGYPLKHTMFEVTSKAPYVLNRTLEKCVPNEIVMICRPDFGSLNTNERVCNLTKKFEITNLNDMFYPGQYYLTSQITEGLPDDIESGMYLMLEVKRTITRTGKTYSLEQRIINAKTPDSFYIRTQYCYSHLPDNISWTNWIKFVPANLNVSSEQYNALLERVTQLEKTLAAPSPTEPEEENPDEPGEPTE